MRKKINIIADCFMFLVKAVLTALIIGVIIKTPAMAKAIWSYCTGVDTGLMWVVNMFIAMIVTGITWYKLRRMKVGFRAIVSALAFMITIFATEVFIWHQEEIWQLLSGDISSKEVLAAGFTLLSATIAYIFHTVSQWSTESEAEESAEE